MQYLYISVTPEEMEHYKSIPYSKAYDEFVNKHIERHIVCGYGVYNVVFLEEENMVKVSIGSSCD